MTPTNRLARWLRERYARAQERLGLRAWFAPEILPLDVWVNRLFHESSIRTPTSVQLLTEEQTLSVWRELIRADTMSPLLNLVATTKSAWQAWRAMKSWCFSEEILSSEAIAELDLTHENRVFIRWAKQFATRCQRNEWIDPASVIDVLIDRCHRGQLAFPPEVIWYGFDACTQQEARFCAALRENVPLVEMASASTQGSHAVCVSFVDRVREVEAAAQWGRALLERDPHCTIGVIAAELDVYRDEIQTRFEQVLCPSTIIENRDTTTPLFSLSLGNTLSDYPLASTALQLLVCSMRDDDIEFDVLSEVICSPMIRGATSERTARSRLIRRIAKSELLEIPHSAFFAVRPVYEWRRELALCPELEALFRRVGTFIEQHMEPKRSSDWAHVFAELLQMWGWPGEFSLTDEEHRAISAWHEALLRLAQMDDVADERNDAMTARDALSHLKLLVEAMRVQTDNDAAQVHIVSASEAIGLVFDHVWILGVHDRAWPEAKMPHPFLPLTLQRRAGMSAALPAMQREESFKQFQTVLGAASHVTVSYPRQIDDEECVASPLLAQCDVERRDRDDENRSIDAHESNRSVAQIVYESKLIETIVDDRGPRYEQNAIKGGTSLFKDQAACPFRAFARFRLGAEERHLATLGFSARERGIFVHAALQELWMTLKQSQALQELPEPMVQSLIETVVDHALSSTMTSMTQAMKQRWLKLERRRLVRILGAWLEVERVRSPFEIVELEKTYPVRIGTLQGETRIDRIDRTAKGDRVILDYKTGTYGIKWIDERPDEPQLFLYQTTQTEPVSALMIAAINLRNPRLYGVERVEDGVKVTSLPSGAIRELKGEPTQDVTWEALTIQWRTALERLADEFVQGVARVDPKKDETTCRSCSFSSLCRVYEQRGIE